MREMLAEVFASIRMNKQRSILAGVSTAWGIFMLVVLLGAGQGLIRGISSNYDYMSRNIMRIVPGTTAMPYNGRQEGRDIILTSDDGEFLANEFPDVVSRVLPMIKQDIQASRGKYNTVTQSCGVVPGYMDCRYIRIFCGRDINDLDIQGRRKVCMLSRRMASLLLSSDDEDALGKYVQLGGVPFMVIGIYESVRSYIMVNDVYVPLSTSMFIWRPSGHYDEICLFLEGLDTKEANEEFKQLVFETMGKHEGYDVRDIAALSLEENMDFYLMVTGLLGVVSLAIWCIGILALVSGVVGVGNIMFISVKERTFELGLRRVMGASDLSIMGLVLIEAVITMLIFGYVGMMSGVGLMRFISASTADMGNDTYSVFGSMDVKVSIVIAANVVLVIGGIIAGWAPARHAIRMELTDALNS